MLFPEIWSVVDDEVMGSRSMSVPQGQRTSIPDMMAVIQLDGPGYKNHQMQKIC